METTMAGAEFPGRTWLRRVWRSLSRPGALAVLVTGAAILSGTLTYFVMSGIGPFGPSPEVIVGLMLLNLALILTLAALISWRLVGMFMARKSGSAGAKLHRRLVALFSTIAVVPAILVAAFAAISLNLGMEAWFSDRVQTALDRAVGVANAYLEEHKQVVRSSVVDMAYDINRAVSLLELDQFNFERNLAVQANARGLSAAVVYDDAGVVLAQAKMGYLTAIVPPDAQHFDRARNGEVVIDTEAEDNQVRALVRIEGLIARFLLVIRYVEADVLSKVNETTDAVGEYQRLEENRSGIQITFAGVYVAVALVILLTAIWLGLWAANKLVAPIGRLIGAAERVSEGDLMARVEVDKGDDEIATLGRVFNRMTGQLESQRNELMEANRQYDARRRFTEAVLAGVSAGVIGLDNQGQVNIVNRSALSILGMSRDAFVGRRLADSVPEIAPLVRAAMTNPQARIQGNLDLARDGTTRHFSVRVTSELGENERRGYVVTLDDITELVSAQRTAAWADVARRIAHEIKNPLTPIQLSAERLRRKYASEVTSDPEVFEQCTQTIIRQVSDIGRMVDEFSSFARMPAPTIRPEDINELVRQAVFLHRVGNPQITYDIALPEEQIVIPCDGRLVSQALINVLKNATEAVAARWGAPEGGTEGKGRIEITLERDDHTVSISVADNGVGLPLEGRNRLTEPYVTTRAKGTGLGLAIVRKIMEDHGGSIVLEDAPETDRRGESRGGGALVRLIFKMDAVELKPETSDELKERATQGA